ncbi:MAG: glycosyltransferase family 2 protein [Anaerolineae bacterium]
MIDLAVVIVSWNTRDLVVQAIRSLLEDVSTSGLAVQVWLVDNASTDGTVEAVQTAFPGVKVIASRENLGFVRGNNAALRAIGFDSADGTVPPADLPRAVYLLNPDTITTSGATRTLYNALMDNPKIGLVGAHLSYEDGSFQHGAFAFPGLRQIWVEFFPTPGRLIEGRFNGRYPRALYDHGQPFPVDFVLGATMMLKREIIEKTGLFDESFFMYCEEIDWAWRIHKAGWGVSCVPAAHVVHLAGKSTGQVRALSVERLWTSRLHLYEKHQPRWKVWAARRLIAWGMQRKLRALGVMTPENQPLAEAYQRVRGLALGKTALMTTGEKQPV